MFILSLILEMDPSLIFSIALLINNKLYHHTGLYWQSSNIIPICFLAMCNNVTSYIHMHNYIYKV